VSERVVILTVVAVYLAAMLSIGLWARRAKPTADEYFLGGRRLPYWVIALSMNATGESAWLLLGLSGLAYFVGVHALWVVVGETVGIALAWRYVAPRLNAEASRRGSLTVPDFLAARFGDPGNQLRLLAVAIILSMVVIYAAAQMLATGKAFETFLGLDYVAGVLIGGVVTVGYTAFGGFRAVAYTDTVQALFMLFALTVVPAVGVAQIGSVGELFARLAAIDPRLLSLAGPPVGELAIVVAIASALAVGLPFLGVPQLLVRFMAASSPKDIRRAAPLSVAVILLFDLGAVATGLVGRALHPGLDDSERVLPVLSGELFAPLVTGVIVVAVLSAIMSTVSSLLNLASSALARDLYQQCWRPNASEATVSALGLWATLVVGVLACVTALNQDGLIFSLVLFAWGGLGAAFGPVVLCALWWPGTTRAGALAGCAGGFAATIVWVVLFKHHAYDLYELVPGFLVGLALVLGVSRWSRRGRSG